MNTQGRNFHESIVSRAERTSRYYKRFLIVGGLVGAFCPLVYGAWLFVAAGDGTSAFGGLAVILVGCPLAWIAFAAIGAALGGLFDVIAFPSKQSKDTAALSIGAIAFHLASALVAIQIHGKTHESAVRSYILSVCRSVEQYQEKTGHYPASLTEIETTHLEDDCGIPLEALRYGSRDALENDVYGANFVVSYELGHGYVARANLVSSRVVSVYGGRHTVTKSAEKSRTSLLPESSER